MTIYAFLEHYPSPDKMYFDTQFEQFVRDGHELRIFAFGQWDGQIASKVYELGLDRATRYLPSTLHTIPRFAGASARNLIRHPFARLSGAVRVLSDRPSAKQTLSNVVRSTLLPVEPPDLCLVHNLITQGHITFMRHLYPRVPVALYYHGGEVPGVPTVSDRDAARAFAAADVVFTNTESSRGHAIDRGCPADRIVVCPVGFNLADFRPEPNRTYRRNGWLNLVSIGRLSEEKGIIHALEAMDQLGEAGVTDVRYRIIGDGPLSRALRTVVVERRLGGVVEFLGSVPFERLHDELGLADALLLPSIVLGTWQENQACVVQEAMLLQTLVAASATGGVPESTAPELRRFSFPAGDSAAIAKTIGCLKELDPAALRALGEAGNVYARSRYNIAHLNDELLSAVSSITTRGRAPHSTPAARPV